MTILVYIKQLSLKKNSCGSLITWHPVPVILFLCLAVHCSSQLFAVCSTEKTKSPFHNNVKETPFYKTLLTSTLKCITKLLISIQITNTCRYANNCLTNGLPPLSSGGVL